MICKKCGHNNSSMALKCSSCGEDMGAAEKLAMFAAQAQMAKGVTAESALPPAQPMSSAPADADDFFADLAPAKPAAPPPPAPRPARAPTPEPAQVSSFFSEVKSVEEPAFETELESLHPELDSGPEEHPLYSPPSNPIIESFIARRAAARGKAI